MKYFLATLAALVVTFAASDLQARDRHDDHRHGRDRHHHHDRHHGHDHHRHHGHGHGRDYHRGHHDHHHGHGHHHRRGVSIYIPGVGYVRF